LLPQLILMQKKIHPGIIVLIIIVALFSCKSSKHSSSKRLPPCAWQVVPIDVDGSNRDWPSPYPEYDDKAMLGYAVSNDKDNLYITVETGDPATQLKILREGLTVWIDKKGEKEEVTGINYPIPTPAGDNGGQRPSSMHAQPGSGGASIDQEQKKRMALEERVRRSLPDAIEYSLQGFKSCNLQFPIMVADSCGVIMHIAIDTDDEMVWEAVVPFKSFYFKSEITKADKGRPISICFETTAMKRPEGQSTHSGGGHGGGSGGGFSPSVGMGGMGMRMGGGGGRDRSNPQAAPDIMEPAYKSTKTYKKFGLAFQQ